MKKLYVNPAAKTANMRIRTSILVGSNTVDQPVNDVPSNGDKNNPIIADTRTRVGASSLD